MKRSAKRVIPRMLGIGAAVAAGAWAITHYGIPAPSKPTAETSGELRPAPTPIVLPETGVASGASVTTADGAFTVHVERVTRSAVKLTVSAERGDDYHFNDAQVGRRLVVPAPDATYFVDLARIRGNTVYLTISKDR